MTGICTLSWPLNAIFALKEIKEIDMELRKDFTWGASIISLLVSHCVTKSSMEDSHE